MLKIFVTGAALVLATSTVLAQKEKRVRYDIVYSNCQGHEMKAQEKDADADKFDEMKLDEWIRFIEACKKVPPPRAPKGTVMSQPKGQPREIVQRPAAAPKGEYYRCNRETKLPDPNGRSICGPPPQ